MISSHFVYQTLFQCFYMSHLSHNKNKDVIMKYSTETIYENVSLTSFTNVGLSVLVIIHPL